MTKDEALKLGLEALEGFIPYLPLKDEAQCNRYDKAIAAVKETLAQPDQEPLAWISTGSARMIHWTADKPAYGDDWVPLYAYPPQPKKQETVAKKHEPTIDLGKYAGTYGGYIKE